MYQFQDLSLGCLIISDRQPDFKAIHRKASDSCDNNMPRTIQITIVPREVGDLVDQLIHDIIYEFKKEPMITEGQSLTDMIPHHYYESYDLYQGTCYQQFTPNMCGYHASYNTLCALNMFSNSGGEYDIQSRSSFWKFKRRVEKFLFAMKKKYKLKDEWPWTEKDILDGDFERTYNKICIQQFNDFQIFRAHPDFNLLSHTWEFQYRNLVGTNESKSELQQKFRQFIAYKGKKPLILCLMLAITTHWTCFLAFKQKEQVQFWYFDSFNNRTLEFTHEQVVEFIEKKNRERIEDGRKEMNKFQKETYVQCHIDIQLSLRTIIDCLKGKTTLAAYHYNQLFDVFGDHLEKAMQLGPPSVEAVLRDYKHNIKSFFNLPIRWDLLTERNTERMTYLFDRGSSIKSMHQEGKMFYSFLHKFKT